MSSKIEGIPDGWELVRVGQVFQGEHLVNNLGQVDRWESENQRVSKNYVIVRKVEKPKKYRPFASAAEADRLLNAVLKFANPAKGSEDCRYRVNSITENGVTIGLQFFNYRKAFEVFVCIDGTPFGVEVTE